MARPKGSKNKPKVGKGPTKGRKAASAADAPKPKGQSVRKVISKANLRALLTECDTHKGRADSHTGKLREAIANAKMTQHLNTEVLAFIRKCRKKEPEDLQLFLDDIAHYLDISGEQDRADSVGKLPLTQPSDGGDDEVSEPQEPPAPVADNVLPLERATG